MHPEVTNLVVLVGTITSTPTVRELPAGGTVVQFDVVTVLGAAPSSATASAPVAWHDPSASQVADLDIGLEVLVVGTVRRRFFRSGGATQSRTEVIVDRLVPTRRAKTARAVLAEVFARGS